MAIRPTGEGLYEPRFEHDNCGVGFVCNIKGRKSHEIVEQGIQILLNLEHRGACGCEANTGDGAGILIQMPHEFLAREAKALDFELPEPGRYAVGTIFLPREINDRNRCQQIFEETIRVEGLRFLGWRTVPVATDEADVGKTARDAEPVMKQIFIGAPEEMAEDHFARKLYVVRKVVENLVKRVESEGMRQAEYFYVSSLSPYVLVYKGMLTPDQVRPYFPDLHDKSVISALALVHSRFSTNTFPSWDLAQPFRWLAHNGEINTLRGNINWMRAREGLLQSALFGEDIKKLLPILKEGDSDSAILDQALELLVLGGRSLPHAMMMLIPEAWSEHKEMDETKRAFYQYHGCLMEPWDGPASVAFTDGRYIGATLDRNGLRPSRYVVTNDDLCVMASEVGVLPIDPANVKLKGRLQPGRMFLIDMAQGRIVDDSELKAQIASEKPYAEWLQKNLIRIEDLPEAPHVPGPDHRTVIQREQAFGYTVEDRNLLIAPAVREGKEPIGSMGNDTPLAVMSDKPRPLYDYFKQLFAQVTNPPLDAIREELVTSVDTTLGSEGNLLEPGAGNARMIELSNPILSNEELAKLEHLELEGLRAKKIPTLFERGSGAEGLRKAMEDVRRQASEAIAEGYSILILSDRGMDKDNVPIPALLACAGVHHHLVREGTRTRCGLVIESGEPREPHHFCLLVAYGAGAVNPYLVFETIDDMIQGGQIEDATHDEAVVCYRQAMRQAIVKVMSKIGISAIQSYRGAQIFEAVGLSRGIIDEYFTHTTSRIGGIGLDVLAEESETRHRAAYPEREPASVPHLDWGGQYQWRRTGEYHLNNPETVAMMQHAVRTGDYELWKKYAAHVDEQSQKLATLRGLLRIRELDQSIPLEEVEPIETIMQRFKGGAMSFGALSAEAHEMLAIGLNRVGGKSNSGEGGEDPARFKPLPNGDSKRSASKQVASGRFGVTSEYLINADEIQIKIAQGAKPGEGGQLPGHKVSEAIAKVRYSTPGVGLISPPPHHDIYSIEDLAQLIHDLKNANPRARINVKLVAAAGVGTIAAGVAKAHADVILISGYDGGTGASPLTSIKHAGLPWEMGLSEAHQVLVMNDLRSRVVLEADGQLKTGRDVIVAALLGAEEYGFATAALIAMGCIMMRVCHLNTCPVGVASQDPRLREKFTATPEHVVNFFQFIAMEVREHMARLGFRTVDEMVGRVDRLESRDLSWHWKAKDLDLSSIIHRVDAGPNVGIRCTTQQDHGLDQALDNQLIRDCAPALVRREPVTLEVPIRNINRTVGTMLGSEITRRYGAEGLPEDTIRLNCKGSAGQSFAAFAPKGLTFAVAGDANDYLGKGLSGAKIILHPPVTATFVPEENIICGNVAFYGATSGEAYIRGVAGERFCVRNSGVHAVVEGVGDHGCEYMTGGRVVILGPTGRNFAAGMSGGTAYVLDETGEFEIRVNREMVDLEPFEAADDLKLVRSMIERHVEFTGSRVGRRILEHWEAYRSKFVKVMPTDYRRVLEEQTREKEAQAAAG